MQRRELTQADLYIIERALVVGLENKTLTSFISETRVNMLLIKINRQWLNRNKSRHNMENNDVDLSDVDKPYDSG